jgi:hypothetical protein
MYWISYDHWTLEVSSHHFLKPSRHPRATPLTLVPRDPADNSRSKDRLEYYMWLAKLADKGKITSIFFADSYGVHQTYNGSADATFMGGSQVANLDPVTLVAAMAAVTKSVSFGITGSTSYIGEKLIHVITTESSLIVLLYSSVSSWSNMGFFGSHYSRSSCLECCDQLQYICSKINGQGRCDAIRGEI